MKMRNRKPRALWFRAKDFGWGWYPITWQGWLITLIYSALFVISFILFFGWLGAATEARIDAGTFILGLIQFLLVIGLLAFSLYRVCMRWGEKPEWRWGRKQ